MHPFFDAPIRASIIDKQSKNIVGHFEGENDRFWLKGGPYRAHFFRLFGGPTYFQCPATRVSSFVVKYSLLRYKHTKSYCRTCSNYAKNLKERQLSIILYYLGLSVQVLSANRAHQGVRFLTLAPPTLRDTD